MKKGYKEFISLLTVLFYALILSSCRYSTFDEERALKFIENQISFGFRIPGSQASKDTSIFISEVLENNGWDIQFQDFTYQGIALRNIIAANAPGNPTLIFGTHYDTRKLSDQESDALLAETPVTGANDGASGVALLLELSYHLNYKDDTIWLVFFDAEDQGNIDHWPWCVGSYYFAEKLTTYPRSVVIVDMIGDKTIEIFQEENSNKYLSNQIWDVAEKLGYGDVFKRKIKYSMLDDHLPFINKGIPATLLIDFDYKYWHTTEDTLDKVSSESLKAVGEVLLNWVETFY